MGSECGGNSTRLNECRLLNMITDPVVKTIVTQVVAARAKRP